MTLFISIQACQKDSRKFSPVPEKENLGTMKEKRKYLNHHIKVGGKEIAKALTNPTFKAELMKVIMTPENDEHAITYKQLLASATLAQYLDDQHLKESINAFKDLDGKDWSPSIRLQMPEDDPNQIVLFDVNSTSQFVDLFAINEGWPEYEMPQVPAMEFINGELWPVDDFYLTEENIDNQPIWVIELDDSGLDTDISLNNEPFGPLTCTNNNEPSFKSSISTMTVKERKEHWLAGKSDIHIMRGTTWKNSNFSPNNLSTTREFWNLGKTRKYKVYQGNQQVEICAADSDGDRIAKFSHRQHIKPQNSVTVNFELMKSWKPVWGSDKDIFTYPSCNKATCVIKGNIMYYTIFEFDAWPAHERTATIPNPASINGATMQVQFRSWDGYYNKGFIDYVHPNGPATPTNIKGFNLNTNSINFNTKIN